MPDGSALSSIERITLRRASAHLGFAYVRLHGVNLHGLRIEQSDEGGLTIMPPVRVHRGWTWPHYSLQPGTREVIEGEIARLWSESRAD
jgi:hypothetical protein